MPISTVTLAIEAEAKIIAEKFVSEYGVVTRAIVAHPKTLFVYALIAGGVIGNIIGLLLHI